MPITTAKYVTLLSAAADTLRALHSLSERAEQAAVDLRKSPDDAQFILARLLATIGSTQPSRQSQITIEKELQIYTPAKIARNERMRDYMRKRGGHQPMTSPDASHSILDETDDQRNARISREEDEAAERMFDARLPTRQLDITPPPNEHLPLTRPLTGAEVLARLKAQRTDGK